MNRISMWNYNKVLSSHNICPIVLFNYICLHSIRFTFLRFDMSKLIRNPKREGHRVSFFLIFLFSCKVH